MLCLLKQKDDSQMVIEISVLGIDAILGALSNMIIFSEGVPVARFFKEKNNMCLFYHFVFPCAAQ